jgi:repressor LexA
MSNIGNRQTMSKNLQRFLRLTGKSRRQVSNDLNLSYSTFCDWINGSKYPRIDKIELLADYFNVMKSDLIEDSETQPSSNAQQGWSEIEELNLTKEEIEQVIKFAKYLKSQRSE